MQNTKTARPATTAKRGIQLNPRLFTKALAKAREVKPRVVAIGSWYGVMMSDQRNYATVHFTVWDGAIWATCTCKAHVLGDHNEGKPVPCYHIAAAALSKGAAAIPASVSRMVERVEQVEVEQEHFHSCISCGSSFSCRDCGVRPCCPDCRQDDDDAALEEAQRQQREFIERAELQNAILHQWELLYPHNSSALLSNALLARFGVNHLEMLPTFYLVGVLRALGGMYDEY
jgi:hypothetical protein